MNPSRGWIAARAHPRIVLAIALALGAAIRFWRLGADEMLRPEAAAWSAAIAPGPRRVFELGLHYDAGKLSLYDLALHYWIAAFGQGVAAMRSLSAILGTVAIALLFVAIREIFASLRDSDPSAADAAAGELVGAYAALLFASNFQMAAMARIVRMYPLMLALMLAQVCFFVRAHRRAAPMNYIAAAIFAALAVAANDTAIFFFVAEALWLAYPRWRQARRANQPRLSTVRPALSLALAALIFAPLAAVAWRSGYGAFEHGAMAWVEPRPPWWPIDALRGMTGNAAFIPILALAIWGMWIEWSRARRAMVLMLCWFAVPFAAVIAISYTVTPLMMERYVLASLVAFLALAGVGLASIRTPWLRGALATLVVIQSLAHIHHHWRKSEDIQWREAAAVARAVAPRGAQIAVMPPDEPLWVVRYYLPVEERSTAVGADAHFGGPERRWSFRCGAEPIAIVETDLPPDAFAAVRRCYPRTVADFRRVAVVGR